MPEPVSTLSTLGAFKRLTFQNVYIFTGSILSFCALFPYISNLFGIKSYGKHTTTFDIVNELLRYLQVPSAWTQDVQLWVDAHSTLVFVVSTFIVLLGGFITASSLVATRNYATLSWGIATYMSTNRQWSDAPKALDIMLILLLFSLLSGTYNSENDPKLHYSGAIFIKTAINYMSMPIIWFVMLCALTFGIKGVAGIPHPKNKKYSSNTGDPSSELTQSGALVAKNKAIDWKRKYRNNRKQSENTNSASKEKQNHTTPPAAPSPPPRSARPSSPGS